MLVLFNGRATVLFKKFGITVKWVESDDPEEFKKAIDKNTKAIYIETIGNPKFNVPNITEIAEAGDLLEILCVEVSTYGVSCLGRSQRRNPFDRRQHFRPWW